MLANQLEDLEKPDIVVFDLNEQAILVVKVQGSPFLVRKRRDKNVVISSLVDYLKVVKILIPFVMFVDLQDIFIYQWDGQNLSAPILHLNSVDVLKLYEPNFSKKEIYDQYLAGLTEAWLGDLAHHWKYSSPPAEKEIADIGLLKLLEYGTTRFSL